MSFARLFTQIRVRRWVEVAYERVRKKRSEQDNNQNNLCKGHLEGLSCSEGFKGNRSAYVVRGRNCSYQQRNGATDYPYKLINGRRLMMQSSAEKKEKNF